jgi:hypothetical protein
VQELKYRRKEEQRCISEEEEKAEVVMQRQRRRSEISRGCKQEDIDAGRAGQCNRTVMRLVSH